MPTRPPELRPYQRALADAATEVAEGRRRALLQLPTGGGKTVIAAEVMRRVERGGGTTLALAHRVEICDQFRRTAARAGLRVGALRAGMPRRPRRPHQIAMVQSMASRAPATAPDLIVIDEAHHAPTASYRAVVERYPRAAVVGLTATPRRLDGTALADDFDELIEGPSVADLIRLGHLSPYRLWQMPGADGVGDDAARATEYTRGELRAAGSASAVADAVHAYERHADTGAGAIFFLPTVRASRIAAERLAARGVRAEHVDGSTTPARRAATLQMLAAGVVQVVTNCDLLGEGFDCPGVVSVVMARPTASAAVYLQQAGRALRPQPGKIARIIDCAGNRARHGRPCEGRSWSLDGERSGAPARQPPACGRCLMPRRHGRPCRWCGWRPRPRRRREVDVRRVDLVEEA